MNRRCSLVHVFILAVAVPVWSGCGAFLAGAQGTRYPAASDGPRAPLSCSPAQSSRAVEQLRTPEYRAFGFASPVADLSGDTYVPPKFFMGAGMSQLEPSGETLQRGTVYDLALSWDVWPRLTLELLYGFWDVVDKPNEEWSATNQLDLNPVMLMVQLAWEPARGRSRFFIGAGGGWSLSTGYNVSSEYEGLMVGSAPGISSYSVDTDDVVLLTQLATGIEVYASSGANVNIGLECRYVTGEIEATERPGASPVPPDLDVEFLLLRAYVCSHF